jgi:TolB-like protein
MGPPSDADELMAMKEFPPFRLDPGDQSLWRDGKRVALTPKAYAVLRYLVERAGRLVTQDELLDAVWPSTFVQPEVLKSQILDVRAALGDRPKDPLYIETVPRRGYRFIAAVHEVQSVVTGQMPVPPPEASTKRPDRTRIAVLPFVNMSSDPDNEYFSDGLTEEIINRLACIGSLQVVARTSAFRFKGVHEDVRAIGAQLDAGSVLEGSVRHSGDQLRVTAQLIDVESGYHLFSQREFRDVFELQDDIAQVVAAEIAPAGEPGPLQTLKSRTANLNAYNAYLRGTHVMSNRFTGASDSLAYFREALELDPLFAPAWAGMSRAYFTQGWFYLAAPNEMMQLSRMAALKALEVDPDSAMGLSCLASVECAVDWAWDRAAKRFRRALELQPGLAEGYQDYAHLCLLPQLHLEPACEASEKAVSLDPLNPWLQAGLIYCYGRAGRLADAIRRHSLAVNVAPDYGPIAAAMGVSYEWNGEPGTAIPLYRLCCDQTANAPYALSCLGHALGVTGQHEEAQEVLMRLEALPTRWPAEEARIQGGLRRTEETLRLLDQAADQRALYLLRTVGDPRFDWLLGNSRYQALLARMGLGSQAKTVAAPPA